MAKTVGVGITGGIASYKIADLVSKLKTNNIDVVVMMTDGATRFISPLTFKTLSGREVATDLWSESLEYKVQHIGIAEQLDLLVIAPATANFIGKMAHGIADDLISTVAVANTAPVLIVPAMNSNMFKNPIVQDNIKKLQSYGYQVMDPESGMLACGVEGKGRLPAVDDIYDRIVSLLYPCSDMSGKRVLVNAGSTCEDIDPVRFIGNRGTGRMGYAIAREASARGADVILVSGKTHLEAPTNVKLVEVWSSQDMCDAMLKYQPMCDIIIGAAAVGDFRLAAIADQKIKKTDNGLQSVMLELVGTTDILKEMGKRKQENQIIIGFAAETENLLENARKKLKSKNLDFIVANDVTIEGAGFATETNVVTFISRDGEVVSLPKMLKEEVAAAILDRVIDLMQA
ncbi:MAG TPA: bifunctional phosphopantothenoylcysteine decarboxylase/phosphopantothenate--cysteine ligase CoaBC [Syntrophomonas sp.]|nr:bifunctional phosphopantothenoylcysteine decarboxylase/phosphopantothenate--cysteine ligase CoaBC [Syntrophomonas sp.]HPT68858.1 bifunctional phosphopantothenoylcysteine decarboxylase/phosphopantothenate--cysteine ligase CoaBC [Syntrophomonas sp.]